MQLLSFTGIMLFFPGCFSQLKTLKTVRATLGTSVTVQCSYTEEYTGNRKYWCREPKSTCHKIVETSGSEKQVKEGRVSIKDNHSLLQFTVTIDNVSKNDAGMYSCGVVVPGNKDLLSLVNITVITRKPGDPDPAELNTASKFDFIFVSSLIYVSGLISIGLKTAVFLCLVFAIIWMHRRRR